MIFDLISDSKEYLQKFRDTLDISHDEHEEIIESSVNISNWSIGSELLDVDTSNSLLQTPIDNDEFGNDSPGKCFLMKYNICKIDIELKNFCSRIVHLLSGKIRLI